MRRDEKALSGEEGKGEGDIHQPWSNTVSQLLHCTQHVRRWAAKACHWMTKLPAQQIESPVFAQKQPNKDPPQAKVTFSTTGITHFLDDVFLFFDSPKFNSADDEREKEGVTRQLLDGSQGVSCVTGQRTVACASQRAP